MHAIKALSEALRQEIKDSDIVVAAVHPALTETAFFQGIDVAEWLRPLKFMRPQTTEAVAAKIAKAVDKRSSRIIFPWQP